MPRPRRLVAFAAGSVLLALPFATGCGRDGESGPVVKGVVLKDGAPYPASELGGEFGLSFVAVRPDGRPGAAFMSDVDTATGAFELTGPTGRGLPPGRYKVRATHHLANGKSLLPDRLATDATPLEVEVSESPAPLRVELGKAPAVTAG